MAKAKPKADNRADTRGGGWCGLPHAVVDSAAYRSLGMTARATLVEILRQFNGYNNGSIAISQRQLAERLGTTNFRAIGAAVANLMERGLIDVAAEGQWKQRQARLYRVTFITTGSAGHVRAATNDYLAWTPTEEKSGADDVSAETPVLADDVSAGKRNAADDVSARLSALRRKTADPAAPIPHAPADDVSSLIVKPYPARESGGGGAPAEASVLTIRPTSETPLVRGHHSASVTSIMGEHRRCDQCGAGFSLTRSDRAHPRRFCSERCRKNAERQRARARAAGERA